MPHVLDLTVPIVMTLKCPEGPLSENNNFKEVLKEHEFSPHFPVSGEKKQKQAKVALPKVKGKQEKPRLYQVG